MATLEAAKGAVVLMAGLGALEFLGGGANIDKVVELAARRDNRGGAGVRRRRPAHRCPRILSFQLQSRL